MVTAVRKMSTLEQFDSKLASMTCALGLFG